MCCSAKPATGAVIMASFEISGLGNLDDAFRRISDIPDAVAQEALGKMSELAAGKIRAQGEAMGVRDPASDVHILDRIKPTKAKKGKDGWYQDVTFSGTRTRNGIRTRNAEIAFVQEYGKRSQQARPFVGTAMEANADAITDAGWEIVGDWMETEFEK